MTTMTDRPHPHDKGAARREIERWLVDNPNLTPSELRDLLDLHHGITVSRQRCDQIKSETLRRPTRAAA